jgi:phospholipid/cholesterol/gamma-HCH transport system substrate-binding protein
VDAVYGDKNMTNSFRWRIALTLVGMVLVLGYLINLKGTFESKLILRADVESASGLFEGMKVTYKGFELGRLTQLELLPTGKVNSTLQIHHKHAGFMTQGSVLKISKEKIVTTELVLIRDESNSAALRSMDQIHVIKDDVAADVTKRIDPLLQKVQLLLTQLSDPDQGIQASLAQSKQVMQQTVHTLELTSRAMQQLGDDKKGLPAVLGHTLQSLEHTNRTMQQLGDEKKGLPAVLGQTRDTMVELEKSLVQTQKTLSGANRLIENVDGSLQDIKAAPVYKWLIPGNANPTKP